MKIGLVLAGGGGKGAYELGVWKALDELKLTKYITVFSGTSIGAFNSVLFAMNDMKKADELWEEVTMDKLVPISKSELIKRCIGLYIGGKIYYFFWIKFIHSCNFFYIPTMNTQFSILLIKNLYFINII